MFHIEYYESCTNLCPVAVFLDNLPAKLKAKSLRDIDLLEEFGTKLRLPYSRPIDDGIFELRTEFGSDISRIFYFFCVGKKIVLTNGYVKKGQKLSISDYNRAKIYKQDYERRYSV